MVEEKKIGNNAAVTEVKRKAYDLLKRLFDIVIAYDLLLLSYIPMMIIGIAIRVSCGGPVIFRQIRIGYGGKKFVCYKFRTMSNDAPPSLSTGEFTDAEKYITPIGRFLRRTSLDELPQLFNVLSGEMSIVGPRPLIPQEERMHEIRKAHGVYSVRPGITGLAQVCGRDMLCDERKAECDAVYVMGRGVRSDVNIMMRTVGNVFAGDGIRRAGHGNKKYN